MIRKILLALILALISSSTMAAPALVRYTKGITGSSVSQTNVNHTSNSGSLLVVIAATSDQGTRFTVSSSGLSFSEDTYNTGVGSPIEDSISIWSAPNVSSGSHSITIAANDPDYIRYVVLEFSGIATSSHVIDSDSNKGFGTSLSAGSVTTGTSDTLIFSAIRTDGDETAHGNIYVGSGFTQVYSFANAEPEQKLMSEYRVVNSGTYSGTWSLQSQDNGGWVAGVIAYAPADGGGDETAPTLQSFVVQSSGTTAIATFDEDVQEVDSEDDWTFSMSGGAVTLTGASVDGPAITYTLSRTINYDETLSSLSYSGTSIEDLSENDLENIADASGEFTNSSSVGAPETYHWVSTSGAAAWGSCVGDTDPGIYCSLATANSNLSASSGQNIAYLVAGTYNSNGERINPSNSGTSSYPLYYIGVGTVTISGSACDGGESEAAVTLNGDDYIIVDNIDATVCDNFIWLTNGANYNEIKNCSFDDSADSSWPTSAIYASDYNWIHDNQLSKGGSADYSGSDHGSVLDIGEESSSSYDSNYNLIEDNVFFHGGHQVIGLMASYNTFRNNYIHNEGWVNGYGNRNLYTNMPSGSAGKNVIEGNRWGYAWRPVDDTSVGNFVLLSPSNIVRYNSIYHSNSYGLALAGYSGYSNATNNRIYNNTLFNNGLLGITGYGLYVTTGAGQTPSGNVMKNNLYYNNDAGAYGGTYSGQTYVNEFTSGNPLFTNASTTPPSDKTDSSVPDLTLSPGSPAINSGGALTTVSSGCNSSTLILADATYFQDGSYAPHDKIDADWIAVGTVDNVQQISSISGNTVTMAGSVSCTNGASVWLYKKSDGVRVLYDTSPDAGAFESPATPATPASVNRLTISGGQLIPGGE